VISLNFYNFGYIKVAIWISGADRGTALRERISLGEDSFHHLFFIANPLPASQWRLPLKVDKERLAFRGKNPA